MQKGEGNKLEWVNLKESTRGELAGHTDQVTSIRCLPGNRAATASKDKTLIIWDLSTGKMAQRLEGHSGLVAHQALSPSGKILASAGFQTDPKTSRTTGWEIRFWNLETLKEHQPPIILPAVGRLDMVITVRDELVTAQLHGTRVEFSPRVKLEGK